MESNRIDETWLTLKQARARLKQDFGVTEHAAAALRGLLRTASIRVTARLVRDYLIDQRSIPSLDSDELEELRLAQSSHSGISISPSFWSIFFEKRKAACIINFNKNVVIIHEKEIKVGTDSDVNQLSLERRMIVMHDVMVDEADLLRNIRDSTFRERTKLNSLDLRSDLVPREKRVVISIRKLEGICPDLFALAKKGELRSYPGLQHVGKRSDRGHLLGTRDLALVLQEICDDALDDVPSLETLDRRARELIVLNEGQRQRP